MFVPGRPAARTRTRFGYADLRGEKQDGTVRCEHLSHSEGDLAGRLWQGGHGGRSWEGVQEPEYVGQKVVIPLLAYAKKALTAADEHLALEIVMMVGFGLRNGEVRAVNVNYVVADERVHEQIPLRHAQAGEAEAPQGGRV
ncbi:hypothetical protein ACWGJT_13370 [Streptomyces xantholiticus]